MDARLPLATLACAALLAGCAMSPPMHAPITLRVVSDTTVGSFVFPESVGCDAANRVLYVGNFGGTKLQPAEKDALGYISKVGLDGKVIEARFLPTGGATMNKPKGIWIEGSRLWVTDIDAVWIFDTTTRKGRRLPIPGATFANDPAVHRGALYVSDNRSDQVFRVEPADFLDAHVQPKVAIVNAGMSVNGNGVFPARDGSLLIVGFAAPDKPRAIHALGADGALKELSPALGRLDGVHELPDRSLLLTEWNSGALSHWSATGGLKPLATGFKGPADFCVMAQGDGFTAYVPDLVKSELRIVRLGR